MILQAESSCEYHKSLLWEARSVQLKSSTGTKTRYMKRGKKLEITWKDLILRICWAKFSYWGCGRVVGWFNAENPALLTFKVLTYINFNEDMGVIKNRSVSQFSSQDKCYFLLSSVAT